MLLSIQCTVTAASVHPKCCMNLQTCAQCITKLATSQLDFTHAASFWWLHLQHKASYMQPISCNTTVAAITSSSH